MRAPRLLRPMFLLGAVVIAIAAFIWLTNPAWHSPLGIAVIVLAILLGLGAIVKDTIDFFQQFKEDEKRKNEP